MSKTITAFDAEFPYRLTEEEAYKLEQIRSLLSVLTSLSGSTSILHPIRPPEFTNTELHEALWGLFVPINAVVEGYQSRVKKLS